MQRRRRSGFSLPFGCFRALCKQQYRAKIIVPDISSISSLSVLTSEELDQRIPEGNIASIMWHAKHMPLQNDGIVPNTLVIANCKIVKPRVAAAEHISQFNEEARSPFVKKVKTIIHPQETCGIVPSTLLVIANCEIVRPQVHAAEQNTSQIDLKMGSKTNLEDGEPSVLPRVGDQYHQPQISLSEEYHR